MTPTTDNRTRSTWGATPEWQTIEQVAAARQISDRTIRRAIAAGALVATRYGRAYRIHRDELAAWDAAQSTAQRAAS